MNIGEAVQLMKAGEYVKRFVWPGITYIFLRGTILYQMNVGIESVYTPTHPDLLGNDWVVITPDR